jgi:hypothetical protein
MNSAGREPGSDEEKWETFRDKFCSYPWFCENRTKTFRAMRISEEHKLRISENLIAFAAHPELWSEVASLDDLAGDEGQRKIMIYLSSELERRHRQWGAPQSRMNARAPSWGRRG